MDLLIHRKWNVRETYEHFFHPPECRQLADFRNRESDFRKSAYSTCVRSRQFPPQLWTRWTMTTTDSKQNTALIHGPLAKYLKLRVAHVPGMPGTFSPPLISKETAKVSDPDMHHGTSVTHVPWCMSGTLTRGGGENVPGIPGACATRNITYLARGPCTTGSLIHWGKVAQNLRQ